MKTLINCNYCGKEFAAWPSQLSYGSGKNCSRQCAFASRKGRPSYVRTPEHRKKMSVSVKNSDLSSHRVRIASINAAKKGKSYEELYRIEKAQTLKTKLAKLGSDNNNWRGGMRRRDYPYIFYKLRTIVMERDNYTCLNCLMTQEEAKNKDRLGRGLTIHHIDHNKDNNELTNLITFCKWCNSSANSRKVDWETVCHNLLGA